MSLDPEYLGPTSLKNDTQRAIGMLGRSLTLSTTTLQTHVVLEVKGLEKEESLEAAAVYLVAAIASSVAADLQVRAALYDEEAQVRDLTRDVESTIGRPEEVDDDFKRMERDPWLWEALSHLLVHLSRGVQAFHPAGRILAKSVVKHDIRDHGLDVIAIYRNESLGISAGECKAYLEDPARGIRDASNKLGEIDKNLREKELRSNVNQLRTALADADHNDLAGAFWKNERCYTPFVCCDKLHSENWSANRPTLTKLHPPPSRKILLPLVLESGRRTFDRLAELMRRYAEGSE